MEANGRTDGSELGSSADGSSILWFRRDLRTHDLPALARAADFEAILPCFVFDDRLISKGRFPSPRRVEFMLGCLAELRQALRELGADLVIRRGDPARILPELARTSGARVVHWTDDVSPWARWRDGIVRSALEADGVEVEVHPGGYIVDDPGAIRSGKGTPYTVYSPFAKAWQQVERRDPCERPKTLAPVGNVDPGEMPTLAELGLDAEPGAPSFEPGEEAARKAAKDYLNGGLGDYGDVRNLPAGGSSRLSPYVRWGCVSPLELEQKLGMRPGKGPRVFRSELAWREFYAAVIENFPGVVEEEFQERYRGTLDWQPDEALLQAWKHGLTGYPLVDAGMREMLAEGWMHNRVRMVVASFLTKDLHIDWREGEKWFMERLIDGDMASNNGGWQWVTSVGTDPAPYFQRMFNPMTQHERFDPESVYVKRWVPELADVPGKKIFRPWLMTAEEQEESGCAIGVDYPAPIVDHAEERRYAVERYRAAAGG